MASAASTIGLRLLVGDHAEAGVGGRGGRLDVRQRLDVAGLEGQAADREVLDRPLGLGPPEGVARHLDLAHGVVLGACLAHAVTVPSPAITPRRLRPWPHAITSSRDRRRAHGGRLRLLLARWRRRPDPAADLADDLAAALSEHSLGEVPLTDEADRATPSPSSSRRSTRCRSRSRCAGVEQPEATDDEPGARDRDAVVAVGPRRTRPLDVRHHGRARARARTAGRWSGRPPRWRPTWPRATPSACAPLTPDRGDITGADGAVLVTERPVLRYGLDKTKVEGAQVARSARRIARILDIDAAAVRRARGGDGRRGLRRGGRAARGRRARGAARLPQGAAARSRCNDTLPLAPTREFAAALLGRVGAGDRGGRRGVRRRDRRRRRGRAVRPPGALRRAAARHDRPGRRRRATRRTSSARSSRSRPSTARTSRRPSTPTLQQRAEDALATLGDGAPGQRARGDPARPTAPSSRPPTARARRARTSPTPGSTRPARPSRSSPRSRCCAAGWRPDDRVACPATTVVDGRSFKNYDDYPASSVGEITLAQAVAQSCNTAFIGNADRLGRATLTAAAQALGLGTDHDLGFPVYFGQVPPPETETGAAADLIGQGTVLASPFAMATVAASVQAGRAVLPVLLPDHEVEQAPPEAPLTGREAATLRGLMRGVVDTGSGRFLLDVPGVDRRQDRHGGVRRARRVRRAATHAWMIATRGDLAVAVFVETGVSGSQTAGPVLEAFLRSADAGDAAREVEEVLLRPVLQQHVVRLLLGRSEDLAHRGRAGRARRWPTRRRGPRRGSAGRGTGGGTRPRRPARWPRGRGSPGRCRRRAAPGRTSTAPRRWPSRCPR